jgi:hypothetical protein
MGSVMVEWAIMCYWFWARTEVLRVLSATAPCERFADCY